jgi:hypothetical protein
MSNKENPKSAFKKCLDSICCKKRQIPKQFQVTPLTEDNLQKSEKSEIELCLKKQVQSFSKGLKEEEPSELKEKR